MGGTNTMLLLLYDLQEGTVFLFTRRSSLRVGSQLLPNSGSPIWMEGMDATLGARHQMARGIFSRVLQSIRPREEDGKRPTEND